MKRITYPNGKEFAFTILDDTDDTTVANGKPVYDLLKEANILITKTVWAFDTEPDNQGPYFAGETLASEEYLKWAHYLHSAGFEIAFHNATMGSAKREETIRALNFLRTEFECDIRLHCNHGQNLENLYWGANRYQSMLLKLLFKAEFKFSKRKRYEGEYSNSPYFWGDIAKQQLSYMRAFSFNKLNGNNIPPKTVYVDSQKPYSPILFNTADAPDINSFNKLVNKESIDRLRSNNGWAIVSTHIGKGFCKNRKLDPTFVETIKHLSKLQGYYVPVSSLLDLLIKELGVINLNSLTRFNMEIQHIIDRIKLKV